MIRKILLAAFAAVFIFAGYIPNAQARELAEPEYLAVYFYADWCPNCKILSPKIEEVKAKDNLNKEDILFVKLDLTDKARIHQSILLAQGLGMGEYLKAQGSGTGYMAVLDANTKEEILRFDGTATSDDIHEGFQNLLNKK